MNQTEMPKSLEECMQIDESAQQLKKWSELVYKYGKWLFWAVIVCGIIFALDACTSTTTELLNYLSGSESNGIAVFFMTAIPWTFYAIFEYCLYNVLGASLAGLASIVQNTKVNTMLTLYQANQNNEPKPEDIQENM